MYIDDNYGVYEEDSMDPDELREFYEETQRQSVWKICVDCGRNVKIKRDYECCNSCADRRERGYGM